MGEIDKAYLKQRGYLKFIEIVLGCICIALYHGGLYGPYSNMSIEWHYPFTYYFNMAAGGLMLIPETVVLSIHALVFTEDLGGHARWYRLDLYACCLMGSVLYSLVNILGWGHIGWPAYNFSSDVDWHLIVASLCALANLVCHVYETVMNVRQYGWHTNHKSEPGAVPVPASEEEIKAAIEVEQEQIAEEKKPIEDFHEPDAVVIETAAVENV